MIILNILLRYYKDMFARLWIFSPSIKLDPQYAPLRKMLEKMTDQQKEPLYFEDLEQPVLGKLLDEQRKITEECRKKKMKPPQVCVVLDDLADRGDILTKRQGGSQGSWMVSLATRGRHFGVTWIISSQVLNLVGSVIRKKREVYVRLEIKEPQRGRDPLRGAFRRLPRENDPKFAEPRDCRGLLLPIRAFGRENQAGYVLAPLRKSSLAYRKRGGWCCGRR